MSSTFINSVNSAYKAVQQNLLNSFPNVEITSTRTQKLIKNAGEKISSAEQRLILGATALATQPFIDYKNRNVDEETRKVSVARTIAKIIAGTLTGYAIRKGCIKGIEAMSQIPKEGIPYYKTLFTPNGMLDNMSDAFKQYRNAMGTIVSLIVMTFTNFAIDAPLTKFLTNLLIKKQEDKQ